MSEDYTLSLVDEEATLRFGRELSPCVNSPLVIYLYGDLGAGKTCFTRGFLQGLGYLDIVKSPTYTLVESYVFPDKIIHHLDLYRFSDPHEWLEAGLDELLVSDAVLLVEWPDKADGILPESDLAIHLSVHEQGRMCTITTKSEKGKQCLNTWINSHAEIS